LRCELPDQPLPRHGHDLAGRLVAELVAEEADRGHDAVNSGRVGHAFGQRDTGLTVCHQVADVRHTAPRMVSRGQGASLYHHSRADRKARNLRPDFDDDPHILIADHAGELLIGKGAAQDH